MADTTPLLASLLMGQRQEYANPFQQQRKYGQDLIVKSSSTAPLGSGNPLEGLARALQGGIGGLLAGYANKGEEDQSAHNVGIYSQAAAERDPQKAAELLKGLKGGGYQQEALLGQIIQNNINEGLKQQQAQGVYSRAGGGAGPIPGAAPAGGSGLGITITPGQQPSYQPGGTPSGLDNNLMNIRASGAPFEQKGPPQNGFETFPTPQAGANATVDNFKAYVQQNPNITVAQAIAKWAPPTENNTNGYISRVSETSGINPGMPLAQLMQNPVEMARLIEAAIPVEKGKIPPGVTPDVLVNAGNRAVAPQGPQMAQAGAPQPPPPQIGQVPPSPEAAQFRAQEQQFARQGDYVQANAYRQKALEAEAKWASALQQKQAEIGMQGAEHDRQQNTATPNNEQALSYGYANRMLNSNNIIGKVGSALANFKDRALDSTVFGVGVPGANYAVSGEYQQARQARDDFINAELRRESGSAISDKEYERADKQYFPVPGDKPETLAMKEKNRALVVEAMQRNAGPTYAPSPLLGQQGSPQQAASPPAAAPAGGPQPGTIEQGYRFKGGNPGDPASWEKVQ